MNRKDSELSLVAASKKLVIYGGFPSLYVFAEERYTHVESVMMQCTSLYGSLDISKLKAVEYGIYRI